MKGKRLSSGLWWLVVVGLAVSVGAAACAGAQKDPAGAGVQKVPADAGNGTIITVVPTTDAAPVSQTAVASVPENDDTAWTYVALGDSVTWGMIPLYA
ncbi:MAG: hypothetical protein P8189_16300, partial [Anaerolineae bacterium]